MGIPFYFRSLVNSHKGLIVPPLKTCNALYLDFNCIVHNCAGKCAADPAATGVPLPALEARIIEASVTYVLELASVCKPSELLYIAVDGVCPRAKMSQQRKRRYMSVWRSKELAKVRPAGAPESPWDSNVVTPGTDFMSRLDKRLLEFAQQASAGHTSLKCQVVCSPSSEPGEGEHKVVQHLRQQLRQGGDTGDVVVYGLDADLILLSLTLKEEGARMSLLRETPEFKAAGKAVAGNPFCTLNIPRLHECLCEQLASMGIAQPSLPDYIVLCSLIGNDFLPPLSHLKIRNDGIEHVLRAYATSSNALGGAALVCTRTGEINWDLLRLTLERLEVSEDAGMVAALDMWYKARPYPPPQGSGPVEVRSHQLDMLPQTDAGRKPKQGTIDPAKPGWRAAYYRSLFGSAEPATVQHACKEYANGLQWTARYYFDRCHDQTWYYPHTYSPTLADLHAHIQIHRCGALAKQKPPAAGAQDQPPAGGSSSRGRKQRQPGEAAYTPELQMLERVLKFE